VVVSVFVDLLKVNGVSVRSKISKSVASVASRSIGYVGAPSKPVRPMFLIDSLIASWHNAFVLPVPTGPEKTLNRDRLS
jgi:hypothetical protein